MLEPIQCEVRPLQGVCAFYQLATSASFIPLGERSIRALNRTVDYIESRWPDAAWLREPARADSLCMKAAEVDGHYLSSAGFTGGQDAIIAARVRRRVR